MQQERVGEVRGTACSVLVVDDDRSSGSALVSLLELIGYRAVACQDGWSALDLARTLDPEVAVLDLALPGLDGFETARRLQSNSRRDVLLIALTGFDRVSDRARSRAAGFALHLAKPLDVERLTTFLRASLGGRRSARGAAGS